MENKLLISITVLLLSIFTISYGYESITVFPKYISNNTSKIVLQYQYKNEYYDTYNFTLSLESSDIVFKDTTVYIPYIKKNQLLTLNITGYVVFHDPSYLITVYKRYLLDGSPISGVHLVKIYRVHNWSPVVNREEIGKKITLNESVGENRTLIISKTTTPIISKNISSNLMVNISKEEKKDNLQKKNISKKAEEKENIPNVSLYNRSKDEITSEEKNYMLYIVLGIITGIIIGLIAVYILSL